jgi:hypothetical protein
LVKSARSSLSIKTTIRTDAADSKITIGIRSGERPSAGGGKCDDGEDLGELHLEG